MSDYWIRYVNLPCTVKGITIQDSTGFYNIYINSLLSSEEQEKALKHELKHILAQDFDCEKPLELVEPYRSYSQKPHLEVLTPSPSPTPCTEIREQSKPITEITTIGQLLQFMVELEMKKAKSHPKPLNKRHIDIYAE